MPTAQRPPVRAGLRARRGRVTSQTAESAPRGTYELGVKAVVMQKISVLQDPGKCIQEDIESPVVRHEKALYGSLKLDGQ